ncbi:MAG: ABC transporter substrate-binding protein, partial [Balneolaceae bacterium]|nr:ABC transporter substrate-binding protein [Balneolaceae bacterium]
MVPKNLSLTVPSILICVIFAISPELRAQSFDDGLRFYRNEQYRQAVQVFDSLESPRARLFSGKSYFGLGAYLKAKSHLRQVGRNVEREVYLESLYTLALTDFRLKQFGSALNHLFVITRENRYTQLISDARQLYVDILNYLTLNQRMQAFQLVDSLQVQHDLIESAFGKVDYNTAHLLLDQLVRVTRLDTTDQRIRRLQGIISDSLRYAYNIAVRNPIRAPKGMIYDIGVALPGFNSQAQGFSVSRGLYYGFLLASEEFNQRNTDKKVFLRFKNTVPEQDISEKTMTDFVWNYQVDAILGPLFSESAWDLANYAEQYQVTMLSPLANSDTLNIDNPYFYQANPTFSVHGSKMAEFAVKELGMDTLAVLAERNSLGAASALSFFERAEKLGARVAYFFLEDLEGQGYEIADYTKFFTTDSTA